MARLSFGKRRSLVALAVASAIVVPLVIAPSAEAVKYKFGVVVEDQANDPTPLVFCIKLSTRQIQAFDLLNRTNLSIYTNMEPTFGRQICWINGVGWLPADHLPQTSCFEDTGGSFRPVNWLLYTHKKAASPALTSVGAAQLTVKRNTVLYLQFAGFGGPPDYLPPPAPVRRSIGQLCAG